MKLDKTGTRLDVRNQEPDDDMGSVYRDWKEHKQKKHHDWKESNTRTLTESGLRFRSTNNGECLFFRDVSKPHVDFYPSTGRWRVVGNDAYTHRGGAKAFLTWYAKQ